MPLKVARTLYSLVKGERIVRFVLTTRLHEENESTAPFVICTFWLRLLLSVGNILHLILAKRPRKSLIIEGQVTSVLKIERPCVCVYIYIYIHTRM
ncbi:hypothetical protein ACOSP7_020600 [Xanthoceras sorbifolium]